MLYIYTLKYIQANMIFTQRSVYGKEFFYPDSECAKILLKAFPHSSGKRKCLTRSQIESLRQIKDIQIEVNLSVQNQLPVII